MQIRFLLGPAGTGKTFRCVRAIQGILKETPSGLPLFLIAPKQATFQLERQILAESSLPGYTRLQVVSFERLALRVLHQLRKPATNLLSEEGRLMVLRSIIDSRQTELPLFRASAASPGFVRELSGSLHELARYRLTDHALHEAASRLPTNSALVAKLREFSLLAGDYARWLASAGLHDPSRILDLATDALNASCGEAAKNIAFEGLWLDGFAEISPQELEFLAALLPKGEAATLAFCLDEPGAAEPSWLSIWSATSRTVQRCRERLSPLGEVSERFLTRDAAQTRFSSSAPLATLEKTFAGNFRSPPHADASSPDLRVVQCADLEAEAVLAAREISRFVRDGGRYRNAAVIVRDLASCHHVISAVFRRYQIPFFMDRRPSVSHHPAVALTVNAMRTIGFGWRREDWFAYLKTGLVAPSEVIDRLENLALANGWGREFWTSPANTPFSDDLGDSIEKCRHQLAAPLVRFAADCGAAPNGVELEKAVLRLWESLELEKTLFKWAEEAETQANLPDVHEAVFEQLKLCFANLALAFANRRKPLNEWLHITATALHGMTVGLIPPALDQVLVGSVDRSRNPDLRLCCVLGFNDTLFPQPPVMGGLLTGAERDELQDLLKISGFNSKDLISREGFYAYIACTRSREKLILSHAATGVNGAALQPSPFLSKIQKTFSAIAKEVFAHDTSSFSIEHRSELVLPYLRHRHQQPVGVPEAIFAIPEFQEARLALEPLATWSEARVSTLHAATVEELYGPKLNLSVSRMEQFAACPFQFFVSAGLGARERVRAEIDSREQGNLQHEVLRRFHEGLEQNKIRWRHLTPEQARLRVREIAAEVAQEFSRGVFQTDPRAKFIARSLAANLANFVGVVVQWMEHYRFDPSAAEVSFGYGENCLPAWEIQLDEKHRLSFRGKIDRVDLCVDEASGIVWCVVIDYKSGTKQLDPLLLDNGLQLQLPTYLNVLQSIGKQSSRFGNKTLVPAGVFYVSLRDRSTRAKTRNEINADPGAGYVHTGRFNAAVLHLLDGRPAARTGLQFKFRLKHNGEPYRNSHEIMPADQFDALLTRTEAHISRMGREIYGGNIRLDPYQKGAMRACDICDYKAICRIEPWRHAFRVLRPALSRQQEE